MGGGGGGKGGVPRGGFYTWAFWVAIRETTDAGTRRLRFPGARRGSFLGSHGRGRAFVLSFHRPRSAYDPNNAFVLVENLQFVVGAACRVFDILYGWFSGSCAYGRASPLLYRCGLDEGGRLDWYAAGIGYVTVGSSVA